MNDVAGFREFLKSRGEMPRMTDDEIKAVLEEAKVYPPESLNGSVRKSIQEGSTVAWVSGRQTLMGKVESVGGDKAAVRVTSWDRKGTFKTGDLVSVLLSSLQEMKSLNGHAPKRFGRSIGDWEEHFAKVGLEKEWKDLLAACQDNDEVLRTAKSMEVGRIEKTAQAKFLTIKKDGYDETVREPDRLIDLADIRQRDSFSCLAACAMMCGKKFGVGPDTLEEWKSILRTSEKESTRPMNIVRYLSELGLEVNPRFNMSLDDLRECWIAGKPVIACIQEYGVPSKHASYLYGHGVVVIGVALDMVFVQDPSMDNLMEGRDIPRDDVPDELVDLATDFLGITV
jgi:predicted double-glycine peptidase